MNPIFLYIAIHFLIVGNAKMHESLSWGVYYHAASFALIVLANCTPRTIRKP